MKRAVSVQVLARFALKQRRAEQRATPRPTVGSRTRRMSSSRAIIVAAALAGLMLSTSLVSASAASKVAFSKAAAPTKPDYSYYVGKTLTWLVPAGPTGYTADLARVMSPIMGQILHATVVPQFMTIGSTAGQDILGTSAPNGLTFGFVSFATYILDIAANSGELSFPLLGAGFIGSSGPGLYVLMACNQPSIKSFEQVATSTTNVTVLQPNIIVGTGLMSDMLTDMYGYPHTYIRSYTSPSLEPGCERGDGTIAVNSIPNWLAANGTSFQPGATPLMTSIAPPKGSPIAAALAGVPTLQQFVKEHPPTKSRIGTLAYKTVLQFLANSTPVNAVIVPHGVQPRITAALRAAYQKAFKNPAVQKVTVDDYEPLENFTPSQMFAWIHTNLKDVAALRTIESQP